MASGEGPKWPGPVTFDDERPKQGYCTVHLKIPGIKAPGMFGGGTPKNADVKQATIDTERVVVQIVNHSDDTEYFYDKQLPEDVDKSKSKVKYKDDRVVLELCKAKPTSWGGHYQHMIKKE